MFFFFLSQPPDMFVVRRRSCMQNVCDVGQVTRSTRPCLIRHNDVSIGLYRAALSYLPNIIDPCPTKSPPGLTVLSIDTSSVFLLCLIPPQVIVPVQRIQSRLTALSIDISSIFLLCLKLSHQNSSFLSNELNLA